MVGMDAAKQILRCAVRRLRIRIQSGPNQGLCWSVATRLNFLRGRYERSLSEFIANTIANDDVVWDVGAHFGYYTLIAAKRTSGNTTGGHVIYSFEPSRRNQWFLFHHVSWNRLNNVLIIAAALGAEVGESVFGGRGTGSGKLGGAGQSVRVLTIDHLVESGICRAPTFMKIDVQGSEAAVIDGGVRTFQRHDVRLCIATHGGEIHAKCLAQLHSLNFSIVDFPERKMIFAARGARVFESIALAQLADAWRVRKQNHHS